MVKPIRELIVCAKDVALHAKLLQMHIEREGVNLSPTLESDYISEIIHFIDATIEHFEEEEGSKR